MLIHHNAGGLCETNSYLLVDEVAQKAAIIDAPDHTTQPLLDLARQNNWDIQYLLLTHGHFDHVADHQLITTAFPQAQVLISHLEEKKLQHPHSMFFELPFTIPPRNADRYLEDGAKISVGTIELEVLLTPGHAEGHACFYCPKEKVIFTGDLIMAGSVGRYDFVDGHLETLKTSLRRILALPPDVTLLSGHGPVSTIARERANNPFTRQWHLAPETK